MGAELRHRLPALAGELLEALGPALGEVATRTAFLVSARGRKRGLARVKKRARAALRSDLAAIKNTALAIALETPDLDPKMFRTPTTGDQRLLTAAAPRPRMLLAIRSRAHRARIAWGLSGRLEQPHS